jgi:carbonic anhydrase/acetyltransferase-like protein (isoleucine patch superfamily)
MEGAGFSEKKYPRFDFFGKIKIGSNVYIGNYALILPGVTVQDDVIIGAGSVVTKSIPSGSIVGGNPAKIIGNLSKYEEHIISKNLNTKGLTSIKKKRILLSLPEEVFVIKNYME